MKPNIPNFIQQDRCPTPFPTLKDAKDHSLRSILSVYLRKVEREVHKVQRCIRKGQIEPLASDFRQCEDARLPR